MAKVADVAAAKAAFVAAVRDGGDTLAAYKAWKSADESVRRDAGVALRAESDRVSELLDRSARLRSEAARQMTAFSHLARTQPDYSPEREAAWREEAAEYAKDAGKPMTFSGYQDFRKLPEAPYIDRSISAALVGVQAPSGYTVELDRALNRLANA